MSFRRFVGPLSGLVAALAFQAVRAELITINVDPNGTTSNLNIFGTTLASGSATWPARTSFRDYQFRLSTASGSATFDAFAVQLSVSRQSNTASDNTLRASLWTGEILSRPNPLLADALTHPGGAGAVGCRPRPGGPGPRRCDRLATPSRDRIRLPCVTGSGAATLLSLMAAAAIGFSSIRRPPSPAPAKLARYGGMMEGVLPDGVTVAQGILVPFV